VEKNTRALVTIPPGLSMILKRLLLGEREIVVVTTVTLNMFFPAECIDSIMLLRMNHW
jgi:hypothetical protein